MYALTTGTELRLFCKPLITRRYRVGMGQTEKEQFLLQSFMNSELQNSKRDSCIDLRSQAHGLGDPLYQKHSAWSNSKGTGV